MVSVAHGRALALTGLALPAQPRYSCLVSCSRPAKARWWPTDGRPEMCRCDDCVASRESLLWTAAFAVTAAGCTGLLALVAMVMQRLVSAVG
jgi:hypothetical protein